MSRFLSTVNIIQNHGSLTLKVQCAGFSGM